MFAITIAFNKRTASAETFETLPIITEEAFNVESVTGSAIEYIDGETHTDIKANSSKIAGATALYDLMSAQGAHVHTDACYKGHNHQASGEQLGYRCPDNAPLTFTYSSSYGQHYTFSCSVCGRTIAIIEHGYDGYYEDFNIQGARYTYRYNATGIYTQMITQYAHSLTNEHPLWNGDIRAMDAFNQLWNQNNTNPSSIPKTYDALYSQYPILLENSNWAGNSQGQVWQGVNPEYKSQAPYNCTASNHAGNTVTLVNETGYSLISGKEYPKLTLTTYQCSADGKQIVHAYMSSYAGYQSGDNTFLVEGLNAQTKSQQAVATIIAYAATNGLPQITVGNYNIPVIMAMYKSNLTTAGYNVVLLEDTGYAKGARTLPDYSTNYYKIRLIPSNATAIPHYLLTSEDTTPYCDQVVTQLTPLMATQSVYVGVPINKQATATYLDGHTSIITCISSFNVNTLGIGQTATLTYSGLIGDARTTGNINCTSTIDVIPNLSSITVVPSATAVYNGTIPTYIVTANYMDSTTKLLTVGQYSSSGWSTGYGNKTVTFTYTEGGKTVNSNVSILVKPNLVGLSVTPNKTSAKYGESINFVITATYENGNSTSVVPVCTQSYNKNLVGVQTISYNYTENGITKSSSVNVTVLDYPLNLSVTLQSNDIYQDCDAIISTYTVNFVSGATSNDAALNRSNFDNIQPGPKTITYYYELNGVTVSCDKAITIKPDLYDITLDTGTFEIYKGQEPEIKVTANFNISGDTPLTPEEFTIAGFHNNTVDRTGTYYTLSYTNKGITISRQVFIRVLPNITSMTVSVPPQTTEGIQIPFCVIVQYEDGINVTVTEADIGGESESRLSIQGYDINQVGYQYITFQFSEGGRTLTETVNIRVRALINISIPLNMLISINPNITGPGGTISPDITLNNASKEPVIISVQSIVPMGGNELNDVLPTAHPDWSNLGKKQSKDIAIGLNCKNNWLINYLEAPLYIAQITGETDVGQIDKESVGSIELLINHGNSHSEHQEFTYSILWHIRLTE